MRPNIALQGALHLSATAPEPGARKSRMPVAFVMVRARPYAADAPHKALSRGIAAQHPSGAFRSRSQVYDI